MTVLDCVVVGASPEGLLMAQKILKESGQAPTILEAHQIADASWRAKRLNLIAANSKCSTQWNQGDLQLGPCLEPLMLRQSKDWVAFDQNAFDADWWVEKKSKSIPPQWSLFAAQAYRVLEGLGFEAQGFPLEQRRAVHELEYKEGVWHISTASGPLEARRVVWAAGLDLLKNSMGRQKIHQYVRSNPDFVEWAEDFVYGVYLTLKFNQIPTLAEGTPLGTLLGFGVKHDGVRLLAVMAPVLRAAQGADADTCDWTQVCEYRIYAALPKVWMEDIKKIASFQKSLRRTVQAIVSSETPAMELWAVARGPLNPVQASAQLWKCNDQDSIQLVGELEVTSDGRTLGTWPLETIG